MKCCPYCGNDYDYYVKVKITGSSRWYHRFDGLQPDNDSMYDNLRHEVSKYTYCGKCDKRLEEFGIY